VDDGPVRRDPPGAPPGAAGSLPPVDESVELALWMQRAADAAAGAPDERLAALLRARGRIGAHPELADRRAIAVAGPLAEVIEAWRRRIEGDGGREVLYIEDGGGNWLTAFLDRPLFVLAAEELIGNVVLHGGEWNRITVTSEPVPGAILVRVRDDGRGIPAEVVRGYAPRAAAAEPAATGLGLVRAILRAHGGRFELASEAGAGSVASCWWPVPPGA
jgi:signal transduction histidine kinase